MVLSYNRITHYPSLAQHPIPSFAFTRQPSDNTTLCLHPQFASKSPKCQVLLKTQTKLPCLCCVFHNRSGNSHWISSGFTVLLADAVEFTCCHADDETTLDKTVQFYFLQHDTPAWRPQRKLLYPLLVMSILLTP